MARICQTREEFAGRAILVWSHAAWASVYLLDMLGELL